MHSIGSLLALVWALHIDCVVERESDESRDTNVRLQNHLSAFRGLKLPLIYNNLWSETYHFLFLIITVYRITSAGIFVGFALEL